MVKGQIVTGGDGIWEVTEGGMDSGIRASEAPKKSHTAVDGAVGGTKRMEQMKSQGLYGKMRQWFR